jgi:two-component system sensor histidine kinase AgrC
MVLLYLLFKVASLAIFMSCLTHLKYSNKKSYIIIVAINIVIWLANYAVYAYKGERFLDSVFPLTASLPAFICFSLVSKYKGFKVLFSLLTVSIYGMLASYIGFLSSLVFRNSIINLFTQIICLVLIIVFILKIFRKPYFKILDILDKGWGIFCTIPCLLIVIVYLLQYYPKPIDSRPENIPVVFFVFSLLFVFYVTAYFNLQNISDYFQLKQDRKVMLIHIDMQKKEYQGIMEKVNATQIYRHDIKHHINVINALLEDNNISEVKSYLSKMSENFNRTVIEKYCENYGLNVILSFYINKAKNENINVISQVDISEDIKIDNIEICVIFANAIENAINACKKIENPSDRRIVVICKEQNDQIYIQITNTFEGEVRFDGEFPISNSIDHGIGTRSIAAIAEKHGGIFSYAADGGIFKTTVILYHD